MRMKSETVEGAMTSLRIHALCALVSCGVLFAVNPARALCEEGSGAGGTGVTGSGSGGTGARGDEGSGTGGTGFTGSGTGGTGLRGDESSGTGGTGVFGTVTGFGSVCVNGLEIEYDDDTRIEQEGREITAEELHVGQVVHVRTRTQAPMHARHIQVETALGGPVEQVDREGGRLVVMGQTIVLRPNARVFDGPGDPRDLSAVSMGGRISVSGLRRPDGLVSASRIDRRPDSARDITTGPAIVVGDRALYVGDVRAELRAGAGETSKERTQVIGRWNAETRSLEDAETRSAPIGATRAGHFSLEGYAEQVAEELRVQGILLDVGSLSKDQRHIRHGERVWVRGRFTDDGRLRLEQLSIEERLGGEERGLDADKDREDDSERSDREDREDRSDQRERTNREDRSGRPERPERSERPERIERPEREDRSGRQ